MRTSQKLKLLLRVSTLVACLSCVSRAQSVDPQHITPEQRTQILRQMAADQREDAEHARWMRYGLLAGAGAVGILIRRWIRERFF